MSCSLTISDNIPGGWAISACQQTGSFLGNELLRDTIPRTLLETKGTCKVGTMGIIGSTLSCVLNGLSLFGLLVLLLPGTMSIYGVTRSRVFYIFIMGCMIFIPALTAMGCLIANQSGAYDNPEDTYVASIVAFSVAMLPYGFLIALLVVFSISGFVIDGFLALFAIVLFAPISKTLFPTLVLLLGSGSIPALYGMSFLEYCAV